MRGALLVCLAAAEGAGCGFSVRGTTDGGGPQDDMGAIDVQPIDVPTAVCSAWHPRHFMPCDIPAPTFDLDLATSGTYVLDTAAGTLVDPGSVAISLSGTTAMIDQGAGEPTAFLVSINSLTVRGVATLRVIGDKPLILAAWGAITVEGTIDAGSQLTMQDPGSPGALVTVTAPGAGASPATLCAATAATAGSNGTSGSGGGGGGGFRGAGGAGGRGDTGGPNPGGPGGAAVGAIPSVVRGGCSGARSGMPLGGAQAPSVSTTISEPGPGGGAIQLSARGAITVTGTITAGGAGGAGAQRGSANGGGGAGSGGFIGLDAAAITLTGTLAANGGGGGSSSRFTTAERGHEGQNGLASSVAAAGGSADNPCALQAPSGSAANLAGGGVPTTTTCDCGGAGGGGGAGFILTWGVFTNAGTTSPSAQPGPT